MKTLPLHFNKKKRVFHRLNESLETPSKRRLDTQEVKDSVAYTILINTLHKISLSSTTRARKVIMRTNIVATSVS